MVTQDQALTNQRTPSVHQRLRTPRAAAVAGILFAVLFVTSMSLIRLAVPDPTADATATPLQREGANWVRFALVLVPFAGIAFLWFVGVVRAHLGPLEDQLFATVFFGSGLLFLAMLFCSAALAGGIIVIYESAPAEFADSEVIVYGRSVIYALMYTYALRMAGVFMLSLGTLWGRTRVVPRLFIGLTYALALVLLIVISYSLWVILIFPGWVLTISIYILVMSLRGTQDKAQSAL